MVCMKKTLPQADVGIFEKSPTSDDLEFLAFEKEYGSEYQPSDFKTSYHAPCKGDSGAGQWMTIQKDKAEPWKNQKMSQRVLVAVYTTEIHGSYTRNDIHGKPILEKGICGGDVTLGDGKRLVGANHCTKTTNERVLKFIKLNAEICEYDGEGRCKIDNWVKF